MMKFVSALVWSLALAGTAGAAEKVFDFTEMALDKAPAGFRSVVAGDGPAGDWKVVMGEVPPLLAPLTDKGPAQVKRPVLAQVNEDKTDERFPMLIFDGDTYGDFTVTTRFKLMSGTVEQMAGIAFRVQDERNFYVIRASGLGNNVRFYKMIAGKRSAPIGPELPVTPKVWHELKVECTGTQIKAWFDGKEIIWPLADLAKGGTSLSDTSFKAGKIAFWTKSDAVTYFTDAKVVYTPRIPLAQTVVEQSLKKNTRLMDLKIYTPDAEGEPRVSGCKNEKDFGAVGGKSEKECMTKGVIFYGKDKDGVSVVMPLRDRNGESVAAVRLRMETFTGQTEQNALARARPIVKDIQARIQNLEDLHQ